MSALIFSPLVQLSRHRLSHWCFLPLLFFVQLHLQRLEKEETSLKVALKLTLIILYKVHATCLDKECTEARNSTIYAPEECLLQMSELQDNRCY